jgi:hypothetical protein
MVEADLLAVRDEEKRRQRTELRLGLGRALMV